MQAHFKRFWFRKWVHQIGHPNSLYESRPFSWRLRLPQSEESQFKPKPMIEIGGMPITDILSL